MVNIVLGAKVDVSTRVKIHGHGYSDWSQLRILILILVVNILSTKVER